MAPIWHQIEKGVGFYGKILPLYNAHEY